MDAFKSAKDTDFEVELLYRNQFTIKNTDISLADIETAIRGYFRDDSYFFLTDGEVYLSDLNNADTSNESVSGEIPVEELADNSTGDVSEVLDT